jgi:hypothetical protein
MCFWHMRFFYVEKCNEKDSATPIEVNTERLKEALTEYPRIFQLYIIKGEIVLITEIYFA